MTNTFIKDWIKLITPLFPSNAEIKDWVEDNNVIINVFWSLGNDKKWAQKKSRSLEITITHEAVNDCINPDESWVKIKKIIELRLLSFNSEYNSLVKTNHPIEKLVISSSQIN